MAEVYFPGKRFLDSGGRPGSREDAIHISWMRGEKDIDCWQSETLRHGIRKLPPSEDLSTNLLDPGLHQGSSLRSLQFDLIPPFLTSVII